MSTSFEQALALALDDLHQDRLAEPDHYLEMVPAARHDEFVDRLTAAMVEGGSGTGEDVSAQAFSRALTAVATVRSTSGPSGILPGALVALRRARGIERDDVLDHLSAELALGADARPALRRFYHRLETGSLLGTKVSHRLLGSLARRFDARVEDFIAAVQPTGPARPPLGAAAMARGSGERPGPPDQTARAARDGRPAGPDPADDLVRRLFCGGPDA